MDLRANIFAILFICIFVSFSKQESPRATLFINLKEYNNSNSKLYNGDCCDGPTTSNKCSSDLCDYVINICVFTADEKSWCQSMQLNADRPPEYVFIGDEGNKQQPINTEWKGSARIDINITDIDGQYTQQLVDHFSFNYTDKGRRTKKFQELVLDGTRQRPSRLKLSMAIQCGTYYYGDECSVFCIPSVDCKGHYSCDEQTGTKICDQGWEGTACTKPKVGEGSCQEQKCKNGGTCSMNKFSNSSNNAFFCCCPPGYTGDQCETDINECDQTPCLYGGTCYNTNGSYICNCHPRYRGMNCETPTKCADNPCKNGKCVDVKDGTFSCLCGTDYSGMFCESKVSTTPKPTTSTKAITTDSTTTPTTTTTSSTTAQTTPTTTTIPTTTTTTTTTTSTTTPTKTTTKTPTTITTKRSTPTMSSTTSALTTELSTSTLRNTTATSVELTLSITMPSAGEVPYKCSDKNACRNNGKCVNGACQCPVGFSGKLCQREIIECKADSCLNGGYCNDVVGNYSCECPSGFVGFRCEKHVENSTLSPPTSACGFCGNGTCYMLNNGTVVCMCRPGFSGKTCTHSQDMCRPFSDALCFRDSECMVKSFRTNMEVCPNSWKGPLCRNGSIPLSRDKECPRIVCKNDGHCYNGKCCCRPGYKGEFCEEEILLCDSSPCQNKATCINLFNNFKCNCQAGWTGKLCEVSLIHSTSTSSTHRAHPISTQYSTPHLPSTTTNSASLETRSISQTKDISQGGTTESLTKAIPVSNRPISTEEITTHLMTNPTSPIALETTVKIASTKSTTPMPSTKSTTITSPTTSATPTITSATPTSTSATPTSTSATPTSTSATPTSTPATPTSTSATPTSTPATPTSTSATPTSTPASSTTITTANPLSTEGFTQQPSSTPMISVGSSKASPGTTLSVSTQRPSTSTSESSDRISSSATVATATVHPIPPHDGGNNSVTLSGKIPNKDIPAVQEVVTNAVRNTSKGENCTDINILDTEYLYNISGNVNTKVTYNSSDCPDASDLHKNPNLTQTINHQLANSGQLSSHVVYNGKTTGLGRSYHAPLIGYVYTVNRRGIKDAIKRAWSSAGNKQVDVLIVDAAYQIGQYGIYITDMSYLVTSGLEFIQPKPENIPTDQSFYKEFQTEFPALQVLMYSGNERYDYASGLRLSLRPRKRTTPFSVADIQRKALKEWKSVIQDDGRCAKQTCDIGLTISPLETTKSRSVDVVLYPTLNKSLNTESTLMAKLKTRLSPYYDRCNGCSRYRYIDIVGRIKLREENDIENAIKGVVGSIDPNWKKLSFISIKSSLSTRLYYLPTSLNDSMTGWPRPNMGGRLDLINSSLNNLNRKLAVHRTRRLHQLVIMEAVATSEQQQTSHLLGTAWATTNTHVPKKDLTTTIQSWNTNYVSSKGDPVTRIQYTLDVLNADSSIAALSPPSAGVMETILKPSGKTFCGCTAYQVRRLWTTDTKGFNTSVIQSAVSKAWIGANNGFNLVIPATVMNSEAGYVAGSGDNVRMYAYYIQPQKGQTIIDEEDLDEPSTVEIEQELSKISPGSRVFPTASKKSDATESNGTEWWVYILIAVGCLALIVMLAFLVTALRARSHRQSRTLKQDPKQMNGYDKEHFSKEPVMEKNSNGLYAVEDEDTDYSKTTYIVNNADNEAYQN